MSDQTPQELPRDQIRELARNAHVNLEKKLAELQHHPPAEEVNLEMLRTEVARLMNELYEHHADLYRLDGHQFNPDAHPYAFMRDLPKFIQYRENLLDEDFWYLYDAKDPNREAAGEGALFPEGQNHGWFIYQRENAPVQQDNFTMSSGDQHSLFSNHDLIAQFIPGIKASYIMGTEVLDDDVAPFQSGNQCYEFQHTPKGMYAFEKPKVTVSAQGQVLFNP